MIKGKKGINISWELIVAGLIVLALLIWFFFFAGGKEPVLKALADRLLNIR